MKNIKSRGLSVIFLMVLSVSFSSLMAQPEKEVLPPTGEYYTMDDYFSKPATEWSLDKINWRDESLYNSPFFDKQFLDTLPQEYYRQIDAGKIISAGKGEWLNAVQIEENIDEVTDLMQLNSGNLNEFLIGEYDIKKLDVSDCWPGECTLKGGVLRNGDKDRLTLESVRALGATIINTAKGEIKIKINQEGVGAEESDAPYGTKKTLSSPVNIQAQDKFSLLVGIEEELELEDKSTETVISATKFRVKVNTQEYTLQKGKFEFNDGMLYLMPPADKKEEVLYGKYAIINNIAVDVFSDISPNKLPVVSSPPEDYFSNALYLGNEELIATGYGYTLEFLPGNDYLSVTTHHSLPTANGNRVVIKPLANKGINVPSKVRITKHSVAGFPLTPDISVLGAAGIINGWKTIEMDGEHFISVPKTVNSFPPLEEAYRLAEMKLSYEKQPENTLIFKDNRIAIGKKTDFLNFQYNQEGEIDLFREVGEKLDKGKVKKPHLVVLSGIYHDQTRSMPGVKAQKWEVDNWNSVQDMFSLNTREDIIPVFIYLGSTYSSKGEKKINEQYVQDILASARKYDVPLTFIGHSLVDYTSGNIYFKINEDPKTKQGSFENLPADTMKIPLNEIGEISKDSSVLCGCGVASPLQTEGTIGFKGISGDDESLSPEETLAFATYLAVKATESSDYTWEKFNIDLSLNKVKFPSCTSYRDVMDGLSSFKVGIKEWKKSPVMEQKC